MYQIYFFHVTEAYEMLGVGCVCVRLQDSGRETKLANNWNILKLTNYVMRGKRFQSNS